jgi:hypothetical protein
MNSKSEQAEKETVIGFVQNTKATSLSMPRLKHTDHKLINDSGRPKG